MMGPYETANAQDSGDGLSQVTTAAGSPIRIKCWKEHSIDNLIFVLKTDSK